MVELQKTFRERLVDFTFYCKERQFMLSPQQTREAFEISRRGFMLDRKLFHYSLKSIYCTRKEHFDRFDEMFDRFWSRYYNELLEPREIKVKPKTKKSTSSSIIFMGAEFNNPHKEEKKETKHTKGANQTVLLRINDFSKVDVEDNQRLEELAE
mgnify:CR=1 FL=1